MAEDNGGNGRNLNYFAKKSKSKGSETDDTGDEGDEPSLGLDIGLGNSGQGKSRSVGAEGFDNAACGSSDVLRREDNPFSFKHFLSRDSSSHGGARPKVYPTPTPPPSPSPRVMPSSDVASASGLPDFVQDHLVIEQCYLNSGAQQQHLAVDLNSISGFAEFPDQNYAMAQDLPFDLTARPPDLGQQQEVGTSKSLPDFLSDGPIRNDRGGPTPSPSLSPERRPVNESSVFLLQLENILKCFRQTDGDSKTLQIENDRLRRELDSLRRQLSDQIVRSETLESELTLLRERDRSGLESLIEQLEDNVRRFRKRADEAEIRASKLKAENNSLKCELETLRNCRERVEGGAACSSAQQTDNERLASQLRNAANTAELSLRHLLIGVDNLRLLAASLETQPQQPVGRRHSSSDGSQDDEPGPAL